jgi:hypothetical protein
VATTIGSWTFVRRRPLAFARETGFVEQGPLVVLSARAQEALLPFPEDQGMAWGIEAHWRADARRHGLRQGIVDAVGVRHLGAVASQYDRREQERALGRALRAAGISDMREIQETLVRFGAAHGWRTRPRPG